MGRARFAVERRGACEPPVLWEIANRERCFLCCSPHNINEDFRGIDERVFAVELRCEWADIVPEDRIVDSYGAIPRDAPGLFVDFFNYGRSSFRVSLNRLDAAGEILDLVERVPGGHL